MQRPENVYATSTKPKNKEIHEFDKEKQQQQKYVKNDNKNCLGWVWVNECGIIGYLFPNLMFCTLSLTKAHQLHIKMFQFREPR